MEFLTSQTFPDRRKFLKNIHPDLFPTSEKGKMNNLASRVNSAFDEYEKTGAQADFLEQIWKEISDKKLAPNVRKVIESYEENM